MPVSLTYLNDRRLLAKAFLDLVSSQNVPAATADAVYHRAWLDYRKADSDYMIASAQEQVRKRERA